MIFFAMIADMLDGRVARMSHTTSSFGGQLDSLCDIISFGVAPAFLMLRVLEYKLTELIKPPILIEGFLVRFIWLSAAVYLSCAAIRLARFNVENEEDETEHLVFVGLPTPAAAGVLASLIIFYEVILPELGKDSLLFAAVQAIIMYCLPFVAMGIAVLMISRIRYSHPLNRYLKGRKPLTHLLWLGGAIGLVWLCGLENALVITFCGFAISGFWRWFYRMVISKSFGKTHNHAPVISTTTEDNQIT